MSGVTVRVGFWNAETQITRFFSFEELGVTEEEYWNMDSVEAENLVKRMIYMEIDE